MLVTRASLTIYLQIGSVKLVSDITAMWLLHRVTCCSHPRVIRNVSECWLLHPGDSRVMFLLFWIQPISSTRNAGRFERLTPKLFLRVSKVLGFLPEIPVNSGRATAAKFLLNNLNVANISRTRTGPIATQFPLQRYVTWVKAIHRHIFCIVIYNCQLLNVWSFSRMRLLKETLRSTNGTYKLIISIGS